MIEEKVMGEVKYMNVWRNHDGSFQWTDPGSEDTREFADSVAEKFADGVDGIFRMAVLRIRFKDSHASDN